ncbi:MAG: GNAT family N-acetyltransferase [Acidobacteria bacterium]|nr:MAG: GNAT family N-acetyltransferase [Acidobacteriota bacterium]
MSIEFVDCTSDCVHALQTFFRRVYRVDYPLATSAGLFEWQFGRPSERAGYCCKLALVGGEITGCLGYVPVEVSVAGRLVRGAWTANWVVDSAQRRLGIGPLLMRELTRQVDVTLVTGLSHDSRALLPRMGWTDLGDLVRYVKVIDPDVVPMLTVDGAVEWPTQHGVRAGTVDRHSSVRRVHRFSDTALTVWDDLWGTRGAGTRRSADFLNWRYADHPVFDYRLFEVHRNRTLLGLAVYRVEAVRDVPVRVGRLVEFLADPVVSGALIDAVIEDAVAQGVGTLDFFCSRRDISPLLERGFLPGHHPAAAQIPILFQPVDRRRCGIPFMAYLHNLAVHERALEWYVTKGDGDQDRPN